VAIYREDYSAKTMHRPAMTELREYVKKNKDDIDQILFVKWDRFSRNIRDSYSLIDEFRRLAVETCAIEQPLDLNVPESKIMLAI
jgi:DNA invertase Pin-like site-specific DNA recombinase